MDNEQIIELFWQRSEDAITALDAKYGLLCHTLSYQLVNNQQDAEECVNDAYLGIWTAIPPAHPHCLSAGTFFRYAFSGKPRHLCAPILVWLFISDNRRAGT